MSRQGIVDNGCGPQQSVCCDADGEVVMKIIEVRRRSNVCPMAVSG
jgi:hypothetical protein